MKLKVLFSILLITSLSRAMKSENKSSNRLKEEKKKLGILLIELNNVKGKVSELKNDIKQTEETIKKLKEQGYTDNQKKGIADIDLIFPWDSYK